MGSSAERTRLFAALASALAPLGLLALVAPWVHAPPLVALALAFASATAAIVAQTALAPYPALGPFRTAAPLALLGALLMATGFALARAGSDAVGTQVVAGLVGSAGVLWLGTAVGSAVGARIQDPAHLMAVAFASSAADIWSVHAPEGVTHALVVTPDVALQRLLTVSAAVPPSRVPDAVIGVGDVLFAALYCAAATRHKLPLARMAAAIGLGLLAAGAATFAAREALPALPFMGAAVVLAQPRTRAVVRKDRFPTMVAFALVLVAIARVVYQRYARG